MSDKCRWIESIKYSGSIVFGDYQSYTILIPECDKDKHLLSISCFKYCPFCSKEVEEVKQ